jgi:hypothetical protein
VGAPSDLPVVNALWIGDALKPMASACLASFARHGHRVVLHMYEPPKKAPPGVEIVDAGETIPSSRIFRHGPTGSFTLFADLFRYELLKRGVGIWVDCDLYCVRPVTASGPYVFGWEWKNSIGNAILGLPPDEPVLDRLIALFSAQSPVPPWLKPEDIKALQARKFAGDTFTIADLPWGAAGPLAASYLFSEAGIARHAAAREVYYPLIWSHFPKLAQRGADISDVVKPHTRAIHLWHETVARNVSKVERGSPLDRLFSTGTLFDETRLETA